MAANAGLQNTVSITTDAFTGTSLISNKTYYYAVIAYASANSAVTDTSYIRGCNNFNIVSAIPIFPWNNPDDPDYFNKGFAVKKNTGTGNMGRVLELSNASVDSIITYNFVKEPIYKSRYAPVNISVIDNSLFTGIDFRLELSSYLEYANATGTFNVGDTIVCTEPYPFVAPTSTQDANIVNPSSYQSLQIPSKAVIKRIVQDNGTSGIFDIEVINQQEGGTFILEFDTSRIQIDGSGNAIEIFIGYKTKPMPFLLKNSPADSAIAIDYIANVIYPSLSKASMKLRHNWSRNVPLACTQFHNLHSSLDNFHLEYSGLLVINLFIKEISPVVVILPWYLKFIFTPQ